VSFPRRSLEHLSLYAHQCVESFHRPDGPHDDAKLLPLVTLRNLKEHHVNRNNLRKAALYGAKIASTDTSHIAVHSAMQRALGFARPPSWEESDSFTPETEKLSDPSQREFIDDPASLSASRAILSLAALDHAVHTITADQHLSPAGRAEMPTPVRINTVKVIAKAGAEVATIGHDVSTREAAFYAAPRLPGGDAQAAHEDVELRDHWRTLPIAKRTPLLEQMQAGNNDRMLAALVRSPIPLEGNDAGLVAGAWRGSVDQRSPKESAALKASRANVDWADSVTRASATYAIRGGGMSKLEMMDAAKGTGGEHLFSDANSIPANTPGQAEAPRAVPV
jgi:hypothetical protein